MKPVSKSAQIRALASDDLPVAEIARRVGVSYQHARNVLAQAGLLPGGPRRAGASKSASASTVKPLLTKEILTAAGFSHAADWQLTPSGDLALSAKPPAEPGVYAFMIANNVMYVGLATMGLPQRLYFYSRPGQSQRTNERLNAAIKAELGEGRAVQVYVACPERMHWRGLPLCANSALEAGLIQAYAIPWNIRGAR